MNFSISNLTSIIPDSWSKYTPSDYAAKKFSEELLPGTFNRLRYEELDRKLKDRAPGYEPLSNYRVETIPTQLGTAVHTYILEAPAKADGTPTDIVIFHPGNCRSSKYLCDFLEKLAGNTRDNEGKWQPSGRTRTVVAPNFVGYKDSSQPYSEDEGALEITAWENSLAVCDWVKENLVGKKENVQIMVAGRSIGTFSTVAALSLPYIKKAILFVPIDSLPSLVQKAFPPIRVMPGFVESIVKKAFPPEKTYPNSAPSAPSGYQTNSFNVVERFQKLSGDKLLAGKQLQIFSAKNDEWVPATAAEEIKEAFGNNNVAICPLEGNHKALPGDSRNLDTLTTLHNFMNALPNNSEDNAVAVNKTINTDQNEITNLV